MAAPPGKGQPQEINSPDGRLRTLHHRMTVNRFGHRTVEGAVRNVSPDASVSAEVRAAYYDAGGTPVGTEADTVRRLGPGRTGAFEIVYSGPRREDIRYYFIEGLVVDNSGG